MRTNINPEFLDYIMESGFKCQWSCYDSYRFSNGQVTIELNGDSIQIYQHREADEVYSSTWQLTHTFTGCNRLSLLDFSLLLNLTQAISLKDNFKKIQNFQS